METLLPCSRILGCAPSLMFKASVSVIMLVLFAPISGYRFSFLLHFLLWPWSLVHALSWRLLYLILSLHLPLLSEIWNNHIYSDWGRAYSSQRTDYVTVWWPWCAGCHLIETWTGSRTHWNGRVFTHILSLVFPSFVNISSSEIILWFGLRLECSHAKVLFGQIWLPLPFWNSSSRRKPSQSAVFLLCFWFSQFSVLSAVIQSISYSCGCIYHFILVFLEVMAEDVDMLDGIPVLDIKPYIPEEAFPQAVVPEWEKNFYHNLWSLEPRWSTNKNTKNVHALRTAHSTSFCHSFCLVFCISPSCRELRNYPIYSDWSHVDSSQGTEAVAVWCSWRAWCHWIETWTGSRTRRHGSDSARSTWFSISLVLLPDYQLIGMILFGDAHPGVFACRSPRRPDLIGDLTSESYQGQHRRKPSQSIHHLILLLIWLSCSFLFLCRRWWRMLTCSMETPVIWHQALHSWNLPFPQAWHCVAKDFSPETYRLLLSWDGTPKNLKPSGYLIFLLSAIRDRCHSVLLTVHL